MPSEYNVRVMLGRPLADTLNNSKHSNMKELRPTQTVRVAFAFDPRQKAILLIGGDKAGRPEARFYKRLIAKADRLYDHHLAQLARRKDRA